MEAAPVAETGMRFRFQLIQSAKPRDFFSGSRDHRHAQGAPLTGWLRVPLTWFQSQTISYFPNETRASIRRTFTPLHAPHSQRNFCGFCGTPLTFWTESPREEADFMSVSLGSLFSDDLSLLEDLGLLPGDEAEHHHDEVVSLGRASEAVTGSATDSPATATPASKPLETYRRAGTIAGIPWFEQMIEGSRLGRIMRSRHGFGVSDDQLTTFEWEISEWQEGSDAESKATSESSGSKRKADEMANI